MKREIEVKFKLFSFHLFTVYTFYSLLSAHTYSSYTTKYNKTNPSIHDGGDTYSLCSKTVTIYKRNKFSDFIPVTLIRRFFLFFLSSFWRLLWCLRGDWIWKEDKRTENRIEKRVFLLKSQWITHYIPVSRLITHKIPWSQKRTLRYRHELS